MGKKILGENTSSRTGFMGKYMNSLEASPMQNAVVSDEGATPKRTGFMDPYKRTLKLPEGNTESAVSGVFEACSHVLGSWMLATHRSQKFVVRQEAAARKIHQPK